MSRAILIRGNSGSGKSTVARLLQRRFGRGTLLIPQDVVRRELLWVNDRPGNPAVGLMCEMARWGAEHCETVIVEGILDSERYRPLFETLRDRFAAVHAYYYDIPFEETLRRHATKPNRADFGEADMRRWWKEKDFTDVLPETVLTVEITAEAAAGMIYAEVNRDPIQ